MLVSDFTISDFTIDELLPHSGESILIDRVLTFNDQVIRCETTVKENGRYTKNGRVSAIVCLEWMAQTVGAFAGLKRKLLHQDIQNGFLLSCRSFELEVSQLAINDVFEIQADALRYGKNALGSFSCAVFRNNERIASGILNTLEGELNAQKT